jgi:hypothetical protein
MSEMSFREWVEQKIEEARGSGEGRRRAEWTQSYRRLRSRIEHWLRKDGGERIQIDDEVVQCKELGSGHYGLNGFRIRIGDSSAHVVPVSPNAIARIHLPGGGELPGEGQVDITSGRARYLLFRTIQDGEDVWYVVGENRYVPAYQRRNADTLFTRERLQEILMDLMS